MAIRYSLIEWPFDKYILLQFGYISWLYLNKGQSSSRIYFGNLDNNAKQWLQALYFMFYSWLDIATIKISYSSVGKPFGISAIEFTNYYPSFKVRTNILKSFYFTDSKDIGSIAI